jgi:spore maturation protein B
MNWTSFIVPSLFFIAIIVALIKRKSPYESFIKGVVEGLGLSKEIFPSIMGMLLAVNILRECGIVEDLGVLLSKTLPKGGFFANLIPMLIFRPLSGSASTAVLNNVCSVFGPDSLLCITCSSIQGSTDTTFYVLALYFGTIGITKWRHSLKVGLIADLVGMSVAIILTLVFFG